MKMDTWITEYESETGSTLVQNLNGISSHEAKLPRRFHKCKPQTRGHINYFTPVELCACGAIRYGGDDFWMEKNSRRKYG